MMADVKDWFKIFEEIGDFEWIVELDVVESEYRLFDFVHYNNNEMEMMNNLIKMNLKAKDLYCSI